MDKEKSIRALVTSLIENTDYYLGGYTPQFCEVSRFKDNTCEYIMLLRTMAKVENITWDIAWDTYIIENTSNSIANKIAKGLKEEDKDFAFVLRVTHGLIGCEEAKEYYTLHPEINEIYKFTHKNNL